MRSSRDSCACWLAVAADVVRVRCVIWTYIHAQRNTFRKQTNTDNGEVELSRTMKMREACTIFAGSAVIRCFSGVFFVFSHRLLSLSHASNDKKRKTEVFGTNVSPVYIAYIQIRQSKWYIHVIAGRQNALSIFLRPQYMQISSVSSSAFNYFSSDLFVFAYFAAYFMKNWRWWSVFLFSLSLSVSEQFTAFDCWLMNIRYSSSLARSI